jgi:hypothetical protein
MSIIHNVYNGAPVRYALRSHEVLFEICQTLKASSKIVSVALRSKLVVYDLMTLFEPVRHIEQHSLHKGWMVFTRT